MRIPVGFKFIINLAAYCIFYCHLQRVSGGNLYFRYPFMFYFSVGIFYHSLLGKHHTFCIWLFQSLTYHIYCTLSKIFKSITLFLYGCTIALPRKHFCPHIPGILFWNLCISSWPEFMIFYGLEQSFSAQHESNWCTW